MLKVLICCSYMVLVCCIPSAIGQTWFTNVAPSYGVEVGYPYQTHSCSWVDYDNDGDEDLLATFLGSPNFKFFRNNYPQASFSPVTNSGISLYLTCYCAVWGDYNNDGFIDVYFCQGEYASPPV